MEQHCDERNEARMRKAMRRKIRPMKILSDLEKEVKDAEERDKCRLSRKD